MLLNAKNGTVSLGDTEMDYISFGKGKKVLIILPGLGDGLTTVKGTALPFAIGYRAYAANYKVYVFSRKNRLKEGCSTRDMAKDQAEVMNELGISKADIMGVSQGGMIAQYLAIDYPNLVGKLVLAVTLSKQNDTYDRAWKLSVLMFRVCCDIAREYGITVYTENLNAEHLTVSGAQLAKFVKAVERDNLNIVFDIGHCHHAGGDIAAEVLACGKYLRHLHLHDNFGDKDAHLPIGEGNIDIAAFCNAIKQLNYNGLYMMELYRCDKDNLASSKERLLQCM